MPIFIQELFLEIILFHIFMFLSMTCNILLKLGTWKYSYLSQYIHSTPRYESLTTPLAFSEYA